MKCVFDGCPNEHDHEVWLNDNTMVHVCEDHLDESLKLPNE